MTLIPQPRTASADPLRSFHGSRALVVATAGGHIAEAARLADRLAFAPDSLFVTSESAQTRSLLARRPVRYVPHTPPRSPLAVARTLPRLLRLARGPHDLVFSTGSGVALAAWLAALVGRKPFVYVESLARTSGPSLTGRILARLPRARLYTQHPSWSSDRWRAGITVLETFRPETLRPENARHTVRDSDRRRRIFVTLGTIEPYRFDRLVEAVKELLHEDDDVTWQLGATRRDDLPGRVVSAMSTTEFDECVRRSDVVVAQAGVGTLLRTLELGVAPIMVPRQRRHGEHVDDHQFGIARTLHDLGLATLRTPESITALDLRGPRPRVINVTDAALGSRTVVP